MLQGRLWVAAEAQTGGPASGASGLADDIVTARASLHAKTRRQRVQQWRKPVQALHSGSCIPGQVHGNAHGQAAKMARAHHDEVVEEAKADEGQPHGERDGAQRPQARLARLLWPARATGYQTVQLERRLELRPAYRCLE